MFVSNEYDSEEVLVRSACTVYHIVILVEFLTSEMQELPKNLIYKYNFLRLENMLQRVSNL